MNLKTKLEPFCNMLVNAKLAWTPYGLKSRNAVFATDCAVFVGKRVLDQELSEFELIDSDSAGHAEALFDAPDSPNAKLIEVGKLRRWAGPPQPRHLCECCEDESLRLDPCWLGPVIVNRNYLAMIARLIGDGNVRISLPDVDGKPVLFDKEDWRIALMPMQPDFFNDPAKDQDLPRFDL